MWLYLFCEILKLNENAPTLRRGMWDSLNLCALGHSDSKWLQNELSCVPVRWALQFYLDGYDRPVSFCSGIVYITHHAQLQLTLKSLRLLCAPNFCFSVCIHTGIHNIFFFSVEKSLKRKFKTVCVYVCVCACLFMYVHVSLMLTHGGKERHQGSSSITPCFISSTQGLSLNLKLTVLLHWLSNKTPKPPVSVLSALGVKAWTSTFTGLLGIWTQALMLSHKHSIYRNLFPAPCVQHCETLSFTKFT